MKQNDSPKADHAKCNDYTQRDSNQAPLERDNSVGIPDFEYINRLPIVKVAREILPELDRDGRITCWRKTAHDIAHLRILPSNKIICDVCGTASMTVLDMVREVGEFETLPEAAECIATLFDVPRKPAGSHRNNPMGDAVPPACKEPLALLVKSGVWSQLPVPVQRLIPVLLERANWTEDSKECVVFLSYRAMMRYSGMRNPNSVSAALAKLEELGWLERLELRQRGESPLKETREYRITPLSSQVRSLADATAPEFGNAIRREKAARKQKREEREQKF